MIRGRVPDCYGHLYDQENMFCQQCLIQYPCGEAAKVKKAPTHTHPGSMELPKDKKSLVLEVCRKYGISTLYRSRKTGDEYEVTEENAKDFFNLDFLLTSKDALLKLLEGD